MQFRHSLVLKISSSQFRSTTPKSWSSQMASFHSTPTCLAKWKNKFFSDARDQRPPKTYIRYATRQKRADAKKALNSLLSNIRCSKILFEEKFPEMERRDDNQADDSDTGRHKYQSKTSARHSVRSRFEKLKCKLRRNNAGEDFEEYPGTQFQATFGNKWYTWSYRTREESSSQSFTGFEWRENPNRTSSGNNRWAHESDEEESDTESYFVGSCTDRTLLGLPPRGPLKIEDVKNAFRLSALKWHPDKHQGPLQAVAKRNSKIVLLLTNHCATLFPSLACGCISVIHFLVPVG